MASAALAERERVAKQLEEEKERLEMTTSELKSGLEVRIQLVVKVTLILSLHGNNRALLRSLNNLRKRRKQLLQC